MKAQLGISPNPKVYIETDFEKSQSLYTGEEIPSYFSHISTCFSHIGIFQVPEPRVKLGIFSSPRAHIEGKRLDIFPSPRDYI